MNFLSVKFPDRIEICFIASALEKKKLIMAKIKYYYDTETCRYERVKVTKTDRVFNISGLLVISLVLGIGMAAVYSYVFPSAKEQKLQVQNKELKLQYDLLNSEVSEAGKMLESLQERDDKLYRAILEAEPIPTEIRKGGTGGSEKYRDLLDENLHNEDLILNTLSKVDQVKKQMYIQTKSYDELSSLVKEKENMLASIPAIKPLKKGERIHFASGFGMRIHPIYKIRKMHTGCDFSAPKGTPVHASGDGVVLRAEWSGGYGRMVEIDHGYGYVTRYAHLSAFKCRRGQKIKRGDLIGKVGNTGSSVSSHLHYEVLHKGKHINPINFFQNDLSPEEYEKMILLSSQDRQSLGGK